MDELKQQQQALFSVPEEVVQKLKELKALTEKYPNSIPVQEAADFLHMDVETLRQIILGGCEFGLWWKRGRYGFFIPTPKFYLWYYKSVLSFAI